MTLLAKAGVDLALPDPVAAVARELEVLVGRLEAELGEAPQDDRIHRRPRQ
jgi:hypothetical protein